MSKEEMKRIINRILKKIKLKAHKEIETNNSITKYPMDLISSICKEIE